MRALVLFIFFIFLFGCTVQAEPKTVSLTISSYNQSSVSAQVLGVNETAGTYAVVSNLTASGRYNSTVTSQFLIVESAHGQRILVTLTNESNQTYPLNFSEPYSLRGIVSPYATLTLYQHGIPLYRTQADPQGVFTFTPVQAGTYDLVGQSRSENLTRIIFDYQTGQTKEWSLTTERMIQVRADGEVLIWYGATPIAPIARSNGYAVFGYVPFGNATLEINGTSRSITIPAQGGTVG